MQNATYEQLRKYDIRVQGYSRGPIQVAPIQGPPKAATKSERDANEFLTSIAKTVLGVR